MTAEGELRAALATWDVTAVAAAFGPNCGGMNQTVSAAPRIGTSVQYQMTGGYPWSLNLLAFGFGFGALKGLIIVTLGYLLINLGYDTIYAVQDMADDARAGIRSSARRLGMGRIRGFVTTCYGLMLALLAATGAMLHVSAIYYLGLIAVAAHARWQIRFGGRSLKSIPSNCALLALPVEKPLFDRAMC